MNSMESFLKEYNIPQETFITLIESSHNYVEFHEKLRHSNYKVPLDNALMRAYNAYWRLYNEP